MSFGGLKNIFKSAKSIRAEEALKASIKSAKSGDEIVSALKKFEPEANITDGDKALLDAIAKGSVDLNLMNKSSALGKIVAAIRVSDEMADVAGDTTKLTAQSKKLLEVLGKSTENVAGDVDFKKLREILGDSAKQTDAIKAKGFWESTSPATQKLLIGAGISVGVIALIMAIRGKRDPTAAIAEELRLISKAATSVVVPTAIDLAKAAGGAGKGFLDGAGITEFFQKWGIWVGVACCVLLMLAVIMMLK